MVSRGGHVGFSAGDRGELVVELFEDGFVCVEAVEEVFGFFEPIVRVRKISGMNDKLIIINVGSKTTNSGVIQSWLDRGNSVPFSSIHGDGIAINSIDTQVDNGTNRKRRLIASCSRTEEVLDTGVGRYYLVVIGSGGSEAGESNCVGPGA